MWLRGLSRDWIRVPLPEADTVHDVSYGNGLFLILGTTHLERQPDTQYACVWTSSTGSQWESHLVSDVMLKNREQLQLSLAVTVESERRGIFLLFADRLYTSRTGEDWISVRQTPWVSSAAPNTLACVMDGYCVALSPGGIQTVISQTSDYGQTWTSRMVGSQFVDTGDNDQGIFIGVGESGNILRGLVRDDSFNIEWNRVTPQFGEEISSLIFAGGRFVASSESYAIFSSFDGAKWNRTESPSLSFVAHGESAFLATFSNGRQVNIYSSVDAEHWILFSQIDGKHEVVQFLFDGHSFLMMGRKCDDCDQFESEEGDEEYVPFLYSSSHGTSWELEDLSGISDSFPIMVVWNSEIGRAHV